MEGYQFKIEGKAARSTVRLPVALTALENFQGAMEKSYLVANGKSRMTAKDREIFYLDVSEFKRGSLITVFEIAIQTGQLALPVFSSLGPQNLWDYGRESFNLLKLVCASTKAGETPKYEFNNDGDASVHIGDVVHNYHAPVIQIAELSLPHYQALAHLCEPGKLDSISAQSRHLTEPEIYLGQKDRNAFDIPTRVEKEPIVLDGNIFDFNKFRNTGKISITEEGQAVPPGNYNFSVLGDQGKVEYIQSMLQSEVTVHTLVEIAPNPFGEESIESLMVVEVGL